MGISWDYGELKYDIDWAREFRYDGARQRYMNAVLNPGDLENEIFTYDSTTWTDYDGDSVYGDFEMIGGAATEVRSFEPGIGKFDWSTGSSVAPVAGSVHFYHMNQIGTTRFMTDSGGAGILPATYTAFGERIDGTDHRYGYAGAWGYQTHDDLPFLHVGHRYYDSATGRFLQRDPIGISDGLNVNEYVRSSPTQWIDWGGSERRKLRDTKTGRFKRKPWWRRAAKRTGWATLACVLIDLAERHAIPRLDKWIDDNYENEMEDLNNPPPTPPPGPRPRQEPPDVEVLPCFTHVL